MGAYSGSVYLSTILGSWLADRLWGAERTLFYSGILVMLGHLALAIIPDLVRFDLWFGDDCIGQWGRESVCQFDGGFTFMRVAAPIA